MFNFVKGLFKFEPGTGESKTVVGIILIFVWMWVADKNPQLAEMLPRMDDVIYAYTGVAFVDRLQKIIKSN